MFGLRVEVVTTEDASREFHPQQSQLLALLPQPPGGNMTYTRSLWRSGLALLLTLICTSLSFGQTSSLSGTTLDPEGNAVAGATITATNMVTGLTRTVTSSKEGSYQMPQLPPGTYKIRAEAKGFKAVLLEDIQVLVST